jgi:hypothetical protein
VEPIEDRLDHRPRLLRLDQLHTTLDRLAQREPAGRVDLHLPGVGGRTEPEPPVDRALRDCQPGQRHAAVGRVLEVIGDQPAEEPASSVGRRHSDVGDHPQRHQLAAWVEGLVEARVRRDRDLARADPRFGQPGTGDRHVVGPDVVEPAGPELLGRAALVEPARHRLHPAGHPLVGRVAVLADVQGGELQVGVLVGGTHPDHVTDRVLPRANRFRELTNSEYVCSLK